MGQTRKAEKVLCYTGMNSKKSGVHTEAEFLEIANKWKTKKWACGKTKKNRNTKCPAKGDLKGWIKWSGAIYENEKKCKETKKQLNRNSKKRSSKALKVLDTMAPLFKCRDEKCAKESAKMNKELDILLKGKSKDQRKFDAANKELDTCLDTKCSKENKAYKASIQNLKRA